MHGDDSPCDIWLTAQAHYGPNFKNSLLIRFGTRLRLPVGASVALRVMHPPSRVVAFHGLHYNVETNPLERKLTTRPQRKAEAPPDDL